MNSNNALLYLSLTKIKGSLRNLVRKPVRAVLTALGVLLFIGLMWYMSSRGVLEMTGVGEEIGFMLIIGGMGLILMMVIVFNKKTALLYLNDANYLFGGPFTKRQVKNYLVWETVIQMATIGMAATIYMAIFFNYLITNPAYLWKGLLTLSISGYFVLMYFNYYYIKVAAQKTTFRRAGWFAWLAIVMTIGFIVYFTFNIGEFDFEQILIQVRDNQWFRLVPFFGWSVAAMQNHWVLGYALPLGLGIVFTHLFYEFDGEFYEKATEDAVRVTATRDKMKEAGGQSEVIEAGIDTKKLLRAKNFKFFSGGWAILSRQVLQLIKTKSFMQIGQAILFVLYAILGIIMQDKDVYSVFMIMSVLFSVSIGDLESELKRPFIYLIPDNSFKKLLAALFVTIIRSIVLISLSMLVLYFGLGSSLGETLFIGFTLFSITLLYLAIMALVLRFLGFQRNPFIQTLVSMVVYFVTFIPTIIIGLVMVFVFELPIESISSFSFVVNAVLAVIILYFARSVVDGAGIVD